MIVVIMAQMITTIISVCGDIEIRVMYVIMIIVIIKIRV